jgi:hypothetical protein
MHGFPGENVYDDVWHRPALDTPNPIPGCKLITGNISVLMLFKPEEEYATRLVSHPVYMMIQ